MGQAYHLKEHRYGGATSIGRLFLDTINDTRSNESLLTRFSKGASLALDNYRNRKMEKKIERSLDEPESFWEYNGKIGLFVHKPNDPKHQRLILVLPIRGKHRRKYIHAATNSGGLIASLDAHRCSEIADRVSEMIDENLQSVTGGLMDINADPDSFLTLYLHGSSQYGPPNHRIVAHELNKYRKYGLKAEYRGNSNLPSL